MAGAGGYRPALHQCRRGRPDRGRGQIDSYGLTEALLNVNNILITQGTSLPERNLVDGFSGLATGNIHNLGFLTRGQNGTLLTYDQLAYVPVLQLLGFDRDPPAGHDPEKSHGFADLAPVHPSGPPRVRANRNRSVLSPASPKVIPEPMGLLILGVMTMLMTRRTRPRPS